MPDHASPKAARQQRLSMADSLRDQKREQILAVAESMFFERGYAQTTVADIVAALGVTKPYLYYYFRGKDDIFEQLCWRASVACLGSMHVELEDARPAAVKLEDGLRRLAQANIRHFKAGTFSYRETGALDKAFHNKLRALARVFHRELRALLQQAREEGAIEFGNLTLTSHAIGSVVGFMYTWYKPGGPLPQEQMAEEITRILMNIAGFPRPDTADTADTADTGDRHEHIAAPTRRRRRP
jgi:AcrR family transcriptional regulator